MHEVRTVADEPSRPDLVARRERLVLWIVAVLGMTSVVPLLVWVYDIAAFHTTFRAVAIPGACLLVAFGVVVRGGRRWPHVRSTLRLGVVAGLIGTVGYDVFRVPFVVLTRFGLLRPIESYGVLALDASESSAVTAFVGWAYHFSNGIGFAIAYMALARGRHWAWGLAWAMVLESGSVFTPFAQDYNLWDNPTAIVIAYGAHVPYGLALGIIGQRRETWERYLSDAGRHVVPGSLVVGVAVLGLWLRPGIDSPDVDRGRAVADGPSAVVSDERFSPVWMRTDACVTVRNDDDVPYTFDDAVGAPAIGPGESGELCFDASRVHRVNPTGEPHDGGFVIVDEYAGEDA